MLDGLAEGVLVAWAGWWSWLRWRPSAPRGQRPLPIPTSAMLVNPDGGLVSVRTLHGDPPNELLTGQRRYVLDRGASEDHWIYRDHE